MLRRQSEMNETVLDKCHEGEGKLLCRTVLEPADSGLGIQFMHDDVLEPGTTIGEHRHEDEEEVYFVVEGRGTMILDGEVEPIGPGDVSLVRRGHSHGIMNSEAGRMRLLVFCVRK